MINSPKKFVLASDNQGKLVELNKLLEGYGMQGVSQSSLSISSPPETGLSFVENALIKARWAAAQSGLPSLADDSGLVVDLLQGQPGIYSARYAGALANDQLNNEKLLAALADNADHARTARYHCVIVFLRHTSDPMPLVSQGSWEGQIARAPSGTNGFGYDPLFYLPELGQTAAELSATDKNRLSHRGQAMRSLIQQLVNAGTPQY